MYHLSKELTGVVLPHDTYGTHLDNAGNTVDVDLEMRNFEAAGGTLSQIWGNLVIDGYPTTSEFISSPPADEISNYSVSAKFRSDHVFETQYMTVYLKCTDNTCCSPFVTNVEYFFPHRSIPPLIPIKKTIHGVEAAEKSVDHQRVEFLPIGLRAVFNTKLVSEEDQEKYGKTVPYDLYLPSIQHCIDKRVCKECGKYHATQKSLALHKKVCAEKKSKKRRRVSKKRNLIESSDEEIEEEIELNDEMVTNEEMGTNHEIVVNDELEDIEEDEGTDEYLHPSNVSSDIRPRVSLIHQGEFVEQIVNLREWLKSPWSAENNNND